MKNKQLEEISEEDRLPVSYRTIKLPQELWGKIKERGKQEEKALRWVIDESLDAELIPLIESLRQLGIKNEINGGKLVRTPLDDNIIARLNYGKRKTGLSATLLLKICLDKYSNFG